MSINMTFGNAFTLFLVIFHNVNIIWAQENSAVDKRLLLNDPQTVTSQMLSLQREIQTLQTKIAEIDVHQSQIQLLNAQIAQLQQENAGLKQQISHLNSTQDVRILSKIAEIDVHQSQIQLLNAQIAQLQQENAGLKQQISHVNSTQDVRILSKIVEIDVHQSQIQLLNTQVSQLQQENAALKQQISNGNSNHDVQILTTEVATLNQELPLLKMKVDAVVIENQKLMQHSGTTVFPIWGRKSCPVINGTELVYTGITAGKYAGFTGSGTNTLCLPHDPDSLPSDFPTTTYLNGHAVLYGAEYQFTYKNVAIDDDVPCAICKVKPASATMMVPAKRSCPQEWTLQYHGYLSAAHVNEQASDYICVDSDPEHFEGLRQVNSDSFQIYPVMAFCGSLPCQKYQRNQYLPCAVCTM